MQALKFLIFLISILIFNIPTVFAQLRNPTIVEVDSLFYNAKDDKVNLLEINFFLDRLETPRRTFAASDPATYILRRIIEKRKDDKDAPEWDPENPEPYYEYLKGTGLGKAAERARPKFVCDFENGPQMTKSKGKSDSLVVFELAKCLAAKLTIIQNSPDQYTKLVPLSKTQIEQYNMDPGFYLRETRNKMINKLEAINQMVFQYRERTKFEALNNVVYNAFGPSYFIPDENFVAEILNTERTEATNLIDPDSATPTLLNANRIEKLKEEGFDLSNLDPAESFIWKLPDWNNFNAVKGTFSTEEENQFDSYFPKSTETVTFKVLGKTLELPLYDVKLESVKMTAHRSPKFKVSFKNENKEKIVVKVKLGEEVSPAITADRLVKFAGYSREHDYIKYAPVIRMRMAKRGKFKAHEGFVIEKFKDSDGNVIYVKDLGGKRIKTNKPNGATIKGKDINLCRHGKLKFSIATLEALHATYFGEFWHILHRYLVPNEELQEKEFHENCAVLVMDGSFVARPGDAKYKDNSEDGRRHHIRVGHQHLDRDGVQDLREEKGFLFTLALLNIGNIKPINRRTIIELLEDDGGNINDENILMGQTDIGDSFGLRNFRFNSGVLTGYQRNTNLCQWSPSGVEINWRDYGETHMMTNFYRNVTRADLKWGIKLYAPLLTKKYRGVLDKIFQTGAWSEYERDAFQVTFMKKLWDCVQAFEVEQDMIPGNKAVLAKRYTENNIYLDEQYIESEIEKLEEKAEAGLTRRREELKHWWADQEPGRNRSVYGNRGSFGKEALLHYLSVLTNKLTVVEIASNFANFNIAGGRFSAGYGMINNISVVNSDQHRPDRSDGRFTKTQMGGIIYPYFRVINLIRDVFSEEDEESSWAKDFRFPGISMEWKSQQDDVGVSFQIGSVRKKMLSIITHDNTTLDSNLFLPIIPLKHLWNNAKGAIWPITTGMSGKNLWKVIRDDISRPGDIMSFVLIDSDAIMSDNVLNLPIKDLLPPSIAPMLDFFEIGLGFAPYVDEESHMITMRHEGHGRLKVTRLSLNSTRHFFKAYLRLGIRLGYQWAGAEQEAAQESFTFDFSKLGVLDSDELSGLKKEVAEKMSVALFELIHRRDRNIRKNYVVLGYGEPVDERLRYDVDQIITSQVDNTVTRELQKRVKRLPKELTLEEYHQSQTDLLLTTWHKYGVDRLTDINIFSGGQIATPWAQNKQKFVFASSTRRNADNTNFSIGQFEYLFFQGTTEGAIKNVHACSAMTEKDGKLYMDFNNSNVQILHMNQIAHADKEELDEMLGKSNMLIGEHDYLTWFSPLDYDDGLNPDKLSFNSSVLFDAIDEFKSPMGELVTWLKKLRNVKIDNHSVNMEQYEDIIEDVREMHADRFFDGIDIPGAITTGQVQQAIKDFKALTPDILRWFRNFDSWRDFEPDEKLSRYKYKKMKSVLKRITAVANKSRVHYYTLVAMSDEDDDWTPVDEFKFVINRLDQNITSRAAHKVINAIHHWSTRSIIRTFNNFSRKWKIDKLHDEDDVTDHIDELKEEAAKIVKQYKLVTKYQNVRNVPGVRRPLIENVRIYTALVADFFKEVLEEDFGMSLVRSLLDHNKIGERFGYWMHGTVWGPLGQVSAMGHSYQTYIGSTKAPEKGLEFLNFKTIGKPFVNCLDSFSLQYNPEDPDRFYMKWFNPETARASVAPQTAIGVPPHGQIFSNDLFPYFYIPGGAIPKIK